MRGDVWPGFNERYHLLWVLGVETRCQHAPANTSTDYDNVGDCGGHGADLVWLGLGWIKVWDESIRSFSLSSILLLEVLFFEKWKYTTLILREK